MPLEKRKATKAFRKKGFEEEKTHHRFFRYYKKNGEPTHIKTFVSHGTKSKTLSNKLSAQMAQQLDLTNKQFEELVECTIDQEEFERIVFGDDE